jgi:multimeric flavodoxin WrbA
MKVLGIYGSPRKAGNTDLLLAEALRGAEAAGGQVSSIRCCDLEISGCIECGGCDETGECIVQDDMQLVYPLLRGADAIIIASPIFFYGITSQAKALIDRCQAMWCRRLLQRRGSTKRLPLDQGKGYLVCVGATKGAHVFQGAELVAKYFYDALGMSYEGGVFVRQVEHKGDIVMHPKAMHEAFELGRRVVFNTG